MVCLQFEDGGEVVGVEAGAHHHPVHPAQPVQPRLEPVLLPDQHLPTSIINTRAVNHISRNSDTSNCVYTLAFMTRLCISSVMYRAVEQQGSPGQPHHAHVQLLGEGLPQLLLAVLSLLIPVQKYLTTIKKYCLDIFLKSDVSKNIF